MKHKGLYLLWCVIASLFSLSVGAQERMTATMNPTAESGKWILEINLENAELGNLTAFQLDLVLPEGFTADEASATASSRLTDHSLTFKKRFGTTYRLMAYSLSASEIVGNSGCVASVEISADNATAAGDYQATLSNILISDRRGEEYEFESVILNWRYEKAAEVYTLTYLVDGEEYAVVSQQVGSAPVLPEVPEKEGHTFVEWQGLPAEMPAENVTVEAVFTVNTYTITYLVDGSVYATQSVAYGAGITPPEAPEKEGHTFTGWESVPESMPATDVTLIATFTVNVYKLTYLLNGEVYAEDSVAYGAVVVPREVEVEDTHTFSGWEGLPEVMPAHDVTVTGTTTLTSIEHLPAHQTFASVYTLGGVCIAKNVDAAWLKARLKAGVYIINGKKYSVGQQ